jgi:hypothetical protein
MTMEPSVERAHHGGAPTPDEPALYIGWDVGGWEGCHDGLAVLRWSRADRLELCGQPKCLRLRGSMASREFSVAGLLRACDAPEAWERVVVGIDAPLGWPVEFARLVGAHFADCGVYVPGPGGEIENRLAYRLCDRVIYRRCRKKPLSAPFDRLGGNASKAMVGCRLLSASDGAVLVPQAGSGGRVTLCEAYPALWKEGSSRKGSVTRQVLAVLQGDRLPEPGTDELDAVLCALTAACYDNQTRGLGRPLPELYLPEDERAVSEEPGIAELVAQEGWVYFPKSALCG